MMPCAMCVWTNAVFAILLSDYATTGAILNAVVLPWISCTQKKKCVLLQFYFIGVSISSVV